MKLAIATAAVLTITFATNANADTRIDRFCGSNHVNEMASQFDVVPNPDGYFIVSLGEQISEGDPRIILTNNAGFHLCTRQKNTPETDTNKVYLDNSVREVKFLFVPIARWTERPTS